MDIKFEANAVKMIGRIMDTSTPTQPCIPYKPQKADFDPPVPVAQPFERATPESRGVPSELVRGFLEALKSDPSLNMHGVMIVCGGTVICDASFGAFDSEIWHVTHSLCKSITGLAIGMLVDAGRLSVDEKLVKIFEKQVNPLAQITMRALTVKHLLTMRSGVIFNEAGSVTSTEWVRSFLESGLRFEPGTSFNYNSMNTYMLSAIVKEISGEGLAQFLRHRLFEPLGITHICWEKSPEGIEKGGWGLYIRREDLAKIGQLFINRGLWNRRQLISSVWIDEMCRVGSEVPENYGNFNYGYQVWLGRHENSVLFNGMFGQNVYIYPKKGIVIVANGSFADLFQRNDFYGTVSRFFGGFVPSAEPLREDVGHRKLLAYLDELKNGKKQSFLGGLIRKRYFKKQCGSLSGRHYTADGGSAQSTGLLPLIVQVMQNNYTRGISAVSFETENRVLNAVFTESDIEYRLPVSYGAPKRCVLDFGGEKYQCAVGSSFAETEDGESVLRLRIDFLETANTRIVKIYFTDGSLRIKLCELPDASVLTSDMGPLLSELAAFSGKKLIGALISKADKHYIREYICFKADQIFVPVIYARKSAGKG